ncbi:MAG: glycosyltransferase family 2 protein [Deltaproteobacteria bacterium]|nr:glycosyltransferase family 2 protein [Deltaproteobacteria bacterium]
MKCCVVLPTYNNISTIEGMVVSLQPHGYPILIVNDGSGPEMKTILDRLAQERRVTVLHRDKNGGKGAAVKDAISWAKKQGFTHVLQMDADNQHAVKDIPMFVEAAQNAPNALILGKPIFPSNTPKSRLNGRKISIVWVWIETLSTAIADPMFGYRVYPVEAAYKILKNPFVGKRMDFDPEIAVRMVWRGIDVINIETPVRYFEDGLSHFHYFYDNVRISWMHTRLFIGMLLRSGILLKRRILK